MMTFPTRKYRVALSLFLPAAIAAFAVSGCGRGTGSISGEVRYDGKLLPIGDIAFLSEEGNQQVMHADIIDGKYSIPSIEVGRATVIVTTWQPEIPGRKPGRRGKLKPVTPPPNFPKAILIPKRYGIPEQSGLTYEVKRGAQTKNFDLEP